ncbi:hypothetical protein F9802_12820 [Bacillus aerolatus]|uniref:Uncharacterized protein n=1 Tax=Bacillus aerolatus TaxID=2653354 RepID=A0A6I1FI79_9BACI|nr:hypothetical protein [Bacillus aerolatus]KAB7705943.1 hypothetical protein F9802_12820 [Bacillus aerolatus]
MTKEMRNIHSGNSDPHVDGKNEGIISDPLGASQMGIRIDPKQSESPYRVTALKKDEEMESFKQFFDGEK